MLSIKISTLTAFITVIASFCTPRINVYSADSKSMAGVKVNETNFAILKPAVNRTGSTSERICRPVLIIHTMQLLNPEFQPLQS